MNKIVDYINKYEIDNIVTKIKQQHHDTNDIIAQLVQSRTDYGLKVTYIIQKLEGE